MKNNYTDLYNSINNSVYNLNKKLIEDICIELNHKDKIPLMIDKFLKKNNQITKNDSNIKKNKSAYLFFTEDIRPKLQQKFPKDTMGQLSKRLGKLWQNLKPQDKKKYEKKALHDKNRYQQELHHIYNTQ